jgi:hypothetical protein
MMEQNFQEVEYRKLATERHSHATPALYTIPPRKCWGSIMQLATTVSFLVLSNSKETMNLPYNGV